MWGICVRCGERRRLDAAGPDALYEQRCLRCGGPLRGRSLGLGRSGTIVRCVVCGRRRRSSGQRVSYPDYDFVLMPARLAAWLGEGEQDEEAERYRKGPHPAGSPVCTEHRIMPAQAPSRSGRGQAWTSPPPLFEEALREGHSPRQARALEAPARPGDREAAPRARILERARR